MAKIQKFKYLGFNKLNLAIKKTIAHLKTVHQRLCLPDENNRIPYFVFYEWTVETMQYGFMLAIVYADLFIFTGWLKWVMFPISLGLLRWLWFDFVEITTNAIKGKT